MDMFYLNEFGVALRTDRAENGTFNNGQTKWRCALIVALTELATGRIHEETLKMPSLGMWDSKYVEAGVRRVLLRHFPESKSAQYLRNELGLDDVVFPTDWQDNVGVSTHKALRTLSESPASGFWWNFLYDMDTTLFSALCEYTRRAWTDIASQPKIVRKDVAKALRAAWHACLDDARTIRFDGPYTHEWKERKFSEKGWDIAALEALADKSQSARAAFVRQALLGYTALSYLDADNDWLSMTYYACTPVDPEVLQEKDQDPHDLAPSSPSPDM